MRALQCVLTLLVAVARLFAQQVADPTFDARVDAPAFARQHPKVLFDEGHHNVHKSSTTYRGFVTLLQNDGCVVNVNSAPITAESLRPYNLFVVVGALGAPIADGERARRPAFTNTEVQTVRNWVRAGGSLLLLTDHEPVASATESLVRALGVVPMKDVVVDEEHHLETYYTSNVLASGDNGLLADHAVTRHVRRVVVFGGQSLLFPRSAPAFIRIGARARAQDGGALGNGQAGALRLGRGRVVITGGMGMLSAQLITENGVTGKWGMNVPGVDNRQLVLNVTRWLLEKR